MTGKKSFTLIELIVSMSILVMLALLVTLFARNGYSLYLKEQVISTMQADSNILTNRLANGVRGTFQIKSATATSLTVLSYFAPSDTTPTQVSISQNGNQIVFSTIKGVAAGEIYVYDPSTAVTRTISDSFVSSPNAPLFRYFDESNTLLASPSTITAIHLIEITSTLSSKINGQVASSSTKVELRNLKTNL